MSDKTAYRGSIFYFKDTATMANLPVSKDIQFASGKQSDKNSQAIRDDSQARVGRGLDWLCWVLGGKCCDSRLFADSAGARGRAGDPA